MRKNGSYVTLKIERKGKFIQETWYKNAVKMFSHMNVYEEF
jgi:hypothetical protein